MVNSVQQYTYFSITLFMVLKSPASSMVLSLSCSQFYIIIEIGSLVVNLSALSSDLRKFSISVVYFASVLRRCCVFSNFTLMMSGNSAYTYYSNNSFNLFDNGPIIFVLLTATVNIIY